MRTERPRQTARLEKRELANIPSYWSKEEQGDYLWRLLRDKGIDPGRLYTVEYFPYHQCWLLTQELEPQTQPPDRAAARGGGRLFYTQVSTELRRTAVAAFAAVAARSHHFARFGCKYQLPPKPQATTTTDLVRLLGGSTDDAPCIHFTSEGGWQVASPHVPKTARRD